MKITEIKAGIAAINQAHDFIESNSDSDESCVGNDTIKDLLTLLDVLQKERYRIYFKSAMQSAKRTNKLKTII